VTTQTVGFRDRLARVRTGRPAERRGRALLVGSVLAPLGLVLVGLAWLGAAHTPVLQEQVAYLVSGGLGGVSLVVVGSLLYFSHWQTEQVHETRSQTAQVVEALAGMTAALDRLAGAVGAPVATRLVATPSGTLSHTDDCQVVRGRADLRPVDDGTDLAPCRLCQPLPA
jgi:hypothetical protein